MTITRRAMLAGTAAGVAIPAGALIGADAAHAITPTDSRDVLLGLAAEWWRLEDELNGLYDDVGEDDPRFNSEEARICDEQSSVVDELAQTPANDVAGAARKAHILLGYDGTHDALAASLRADLDRLAGWRAVS